MVFPGRPHYLRFFKGCLPQILLGPLTQIFIFLLGAFIHGESNTLSKRRSSQEYESEERKSTFS